jgi:hypothetical protein
LSNAVHFYILDQRAVRAIFLTRRSGPPTLDEPERAEAAEQQQGGGRQGDRGDTGGDGVV